jgi:hypothetical protein
MKLGEEGKAEFKKSFELYCQILLRVLMKMSVLMFLTFAISKFETSKFLIFLKETEILQSSLESTKSKTESQQSNLQFHKRQVLYY